MGGDRMKIMDNGVIRDMTPEEEAQFIADHEAMIPPWADVDTPEDKAEAYDILMGVES